MWVVLILIIAVFFMVAAALSVCLAREEVGGVVTPQMLRTVIWVESRDNPKAKGKAGEYGLFQMRPIAVLDVQRRYGWKHSFREATTTYARQYGEAFLVMQEVRLRERLKRQPTAKELYRAFNRGFEGSLR